MTKTIDFKNQKIKKSDYFSSDDNSEIRQLYAAWAQWCNEDMQGEWTIDGESPEYPDYFVAIKSKDLLQRMWDAKTDEEKSAEKREIRNCYLSMYVDPIVTNPLRWADLSAEEQDVYKNYRQYLLNITEAEDFPETNILTFAEWKESNNPDSVLSEAESKEVI